jgi:hypothetical protein
MTKIELAKEVLRLYEELSKMDIAIKCSEDGRSWYWHNTDMVSVAFSSSREALWDAATVFGLIDDADAYPYDEPDYNDDDGLTDAEADAMTLANAGMGTDEDYGLFHDSLERDHDEPFMGDS